MRHAGAWLPIEDIEMDCGVVLQTRGDGWHTVTVPVHRVKKGETLASIAARYDVSTQDLKGWNAGASTKVVPGQRLRVVSDAGPVASKKGKRNAGTRPGKGTPAASRVKQASAPSRTVR